MPENHRRRHLALCAALSVMTLSGLIGTAPASAATTSAGTTAAGSGYVRLAHLSPDTPDVDVYLSPANDTSAPQRFPGVGYGTVSGYLRLPVGSYAVSMRPAGADPTSPPVLTTRVGVLEGRAYTVAGVGRYAGLGLKILQDDLTLPSAGKVKIRIVQASVQAPNLDVSVYGGEVIGSRVPFASTTQYRLVSPGKWTLNVGPSGGSTPTQVSVDLSPGNVYSLLVLDGPAGLKAQLRTDAGRHGTVPSGGIDTGAGAGTGNGDATSGGGTAGNDDAAALAADYAATGGPPVAVIVTLAAVLVVLAGVTSLLAIRPRLTRRGGVR